MQAELADGVVVVGAGQSGGRAVEALRGAGYAGPVTLLGDDHDLPYERPSLSKDMLLGSDTVAWVRPAEWYEAADITFRGGARATAIERAARIVRLGDGTALRYGALLLTTGARPRPLPVPGADHPGCHTFRTLGDMRRLRPQLRPGGRIVVIGAGFIGLEVASAARQCCAAVTVIEATGEVMGRCVPPGLGAFYAALHRGRGVELRLNTPVQAIDDAGGRPVAVLAGGERLEADAIVVGIGIVPNIELAAQATLPVANGVLVDAFGRTEDPHIWAAGDVANRFDPRYARHIRLESWQNAQNGAIAVARNIVGPPRPHSEIPWFWSDQHGVNLQIAGLPDAALPWIERGRVGDGPALMFQLGAGRLTCAIGIDAARELRFAKELIALDAHIPAAILADPTRKLADLLREFKQGLHRAA